MAPTLEKDVAEHKDESDNNKSDRHWKRPLKKAKTPAAKPVKVSLRPSALLEEIRRGKMKVGGKDIENLPSRGGAYPIVSSMKATSMHAPLKISEPPLGTSMKQAAEHPKPSLRLEISTILSGIAKIHADDLTPLEEYLNS
uniref:Uncharacterized protein n=1 Tax=Cucumis sativus TaxID=3659 RepID=A0A0A0KQU9_CUCSA